MTNVTKNSFSVARRTLVRGAAWSAPAVAIASAAPASAASSVPTAQFGAFAQVVDSDPSQDYDVTLGVDSNHPVPSASGTQTGTPTSAGGGVFTPGGTIGGLYGGSGLWISAPVDQGGKPLGGTTTLPAGSIFQMTYSVYFPNGAVVPDSWASDVQNYVASNGNDVSFSATYSDGGISADGKTWTGTVSMTTTSPLVVTGAGNYGQVLGSHAATYYDIRDTMTFTTTFTMLSGVLQVAPATGEPTTVNVSGQSATATLSFTG